jgi:hypothetical protein
MLPTACGGSRAVLTHGARSQDIGIQAAAARLSSASARYCTSARQQGERGEQRQRKRQVVAQEPPSATVVCCVSARSNQSNADPRAEEPRPYHEAPADWPRPLLPNPLNVLPRRAPSTSCHLQAARAVRASSYAHSAPSPICSPRSLSPLVRNLPSRRPTSPTIDTRASQLPTPHVHTLLPTLLHQWTACSGPEITHRAVVSDTQVRRQVLTTCKHQTSCHAGIWFIYQGPQHVNKPLL